jgi:cell division septation protein DedD
MKFSKLLLLVPTLFLAACAASGTPFQRITDIPKDKGVVYVYRPNSILGAAVHYDVHPGNDDVICDLIRNGYCVYYSKPGELELWGKTESRSSITIDVKSGQEHFVKGGLSMGFLVGRPNFTAVDNKTGLEEIAECVLLGKLVAATPAAETPVAATPAAETPAAATPATETPVPETSVAETPAAETPAAATPAAETSK